ncbi:zinc finger protein 703 isoform X2 [Arvicanthis niloticus]|uniref:zinc finger protein 703 isoform X2 n=1 Tax=Arvicanthis niloticus TaxID=61156 RepID=UPI00148640AA|nr:zinc finger protein 703 isoform X2 [Arvicanthis niloticus]
MSDSPAGSNPRTPESSGSGGSGGGGKRPAVPAVVSLLPPADPLRQANRLPIRVLKMLSAHTGHLLHPEYLQPLSSTPVSPIEMGQLAGKERITTPITEKSPLTGKAVVEPFLRRASSARDTLRD